MVPLEREHTLRQASQLGVENTIDEVHHRFLGLAHVYAFACRSYCSVVLVARAQAYFVRTMDGVSSGEEDDTFKEHMLEYEQTSLRGVFQNEVDQLIPEWTSLHERSQSNVDFEFKVVSCESTLWCSRAQKWWDNFTGRRNPPS